jgi:hypothetical protein
MIAIYIKTGFLYFLNTGLPVGVLVTNVCLFSFFNYTQQAVLHKFISLAISSESGTTEPSSDHQLEL